MLKSLLLSICLVVGLYAKDSNEVIKNKSDKVSIQNTIKKAAEAYLLSKERDVKFLSGNETTLNEKEFEAILMEKKNASRKINQKFIQYKEYLLTNEDVEKTKPDPEGYIFLINLFKVKKENVIIIEDSPKGLKAAYASGCNVVKVANPDFVTKEIFKEYFK